MYVLTKASSDEFLLKSYTVSHKCVTEVLVDDLTKYSSLPHQVWNRCMCVCVREQLVHSTMDLLLAGLSTAKSL